MNKKQHKQKIMRSGNKTMQVDSNHWHPYHQFQPFMPQLSQPYILSHNRLNTQRQSQKTEQSHVKHISSNASYILNDQMYKIINMDENTVQIGLRKTAKEVYQLVNNELLFSIKHLSSMKLFMYNVMLMYADQFSQHQRLKYSQSKKQKSIGSIKNITTLKQHDIAFNSNRQFQNSIKELQNLKQTIPFVPRDKSLKSKNTRIQLLEQQLSAKIQMTKQSLENILKKIQYQANYRLSGEDIMRLKKSVVNVSELDPSHFLTLHPMIAPQIAKQSTMQGSRHQSRQSQGNGNSSQSRSGSRSKTFTGEFKQIFTAANTNLPVQNVKLDEQDNKLLIEQLQQIIERKQNRIKQLTKQLTKNLSDQRQLEKTIEHFEIEVNQIQRDRKKFQQIVEKLQQENLNYQLEIKELQDAATLRHETNRLSTSHQQDSSHYLMLKQFETRQKVIKFKVSQQVQIFIQNTLQNESRLKQFNSMSCGSPFNDISEITPKRNLKQHFLTKDIDQSYILQSNAVTTRKHLSPQVTSNQRSQSISISKYQMVGNSRTKSKNRNKIEFGSNNRQERKDKDENSYQKILLLQALTIEQMLLDM